jgi:hypothetical protein
MTKLRHLAAIAALAVALPLLAPPSSAQTQARPGTAAAIAKTYGLDGFGKIAAIRYTFNAELPGVKVSRTWVWEPQTDQVSYAAKDKDGKAVKITYLRAKLDDAPANVRDEIDPAFVNDQYNLLFPLHVYWDDSAEVRDLGVQKLPLGQGSARRVTVKYPAEGGYSAGDTWELYIGPGDRIEEFVYHRGGPKKPNLVIARWTAYKKAGPLLISTDRRGTADGKPLHLHFSNVAVKLVGSDKWVTAQ